MLDSLLIANRGEISLRIQRTARRLGIRTIALYTDLDVDAPHTRAADVAVHVSNYLDIDQVIAAAVSTGADAVHPGYGFLSERAPFAAALEAAGITLVGPSAAVMESMGRKDAARDIAVRAGVPVVPQYSLEDRDAIRYPVLVKAAAGGGGKGMRVVESAAELDDGVAAAAREARSAFGDDTLLVETFVERGRHIEVQVFGDAHGNVVHFFERDCSTQRRHQKVLEEAPAPTITAEIRDLVTSSAVALAQHVGYRNAGTVEFLLDESTGQAYFLEMNTRLQVEHPVTELATRLRGAVPDLVELQLRIASGEPLGFEQADVTVGGHAIEARIYAEDAYGGFLPQAGRADVVVWPDGVEGVRVDQALVSGQTVSTAYDPMIGKVIGYGADRERARRALLRGLDGTAVLGLTTNTGFLRALVAGEPFADAMIDTAWLDRVDIGDVAPPPETARLRRFAALALADAARSQSRGALVADGWRSSAPAAPFVAALDEPTPVSVDNELEVAHDVAPGACRVTARVDGFRSQAVVRLAAHGTEVAFRGQRHVFSPPDPTAPEELASGDGTVTSPMPGTVIDVRVAEGDQVEAGGILGAIEAMKMEIALKAPFAGTVEQVRATVGDVVPLGAALFSVVAPASAGAQEAVGGPQ